MENFDYGNCDLIRFFPDFIVIASSLLSAIAVRGERYTE